MHCHYFKGMRLTISYETGSTKGLPVFALVYLVVIGLQTISVIAFTRGNVRMRCRWEEI